MKWARVLIPLAVVAVVGTSIYVFFIKKADEKPSKVTLGTFSKAIGNSPFHIAKHFKWFEDDPRLAGIKIEYREYNDRPTISDALSAGELQVLYCAEVPSILCRAQGNDIRIVALSAKVRQDILVHPESSIKSVPQLKGKSLVVLQGTSSHFCLLKILKADGLREEDLDLRYMPPAEGKVAFEQKRVDAWAVWSPFVEQQEVSGRGRIVPGGDAMIHSVMSVSAPFATKNEPQIQAIYDGIQKAKDWIVKNPQEAQKIIAEEFGLELKVVEKAWGKHEWLAPLNDRVINDIQDVSTFLAEEGKSRGGKDMNVRTELIDLRFRKDEGK